MDKKKTDNTAFEGLACYRLGLRADGGPFSDLGCAARLTTRLTARSRWGSWRMAVAARETRCTSGLRGVFTVDSRNDGTTE